LVDDLPIMDVDDGPRQLGHKPGSLARARPVLVAVLVQGRPGHALHDDERPALVDAEIVDPDQVGMLALSQHLRLADQPPVADRAGPPCRSPSGSCPPRRPGPDTCGSRPRANDSDPQAVCACDPSPLSGRLRRSRCSNFRTSRSAMMVWSGMSRSLTRLPNSG